MWYSTPNSKEKVEYDPVKMAKLRMEFAQQAAILYEIGQRIEEASGDPYQNPWVQLEVAVFDIEVKVADLNRAIKFLTNSKRNEQV